MFLDIVKITLPNALFFRGLYEFCSSGVLIQSTFVLCQEKKSVFFLSLPSFSVYSANQCDRFKGILKAMH